MMSSTSSKSQSPSPELTTKNNTIDPSIETADLSIQQGPTAKEQESTSEGPEHTNSTASNPWQAIFSPHHNTYYFYNTITNETTWINPLQPEASDASAAAPAAQPDTASRAASTSRSPQPEPSQSQPQPGPSGSTPSHVVLQAAAVAQGIDPSLAYLDPSLAFSPAGPAQPHTFTAKFNARTGAFSTASARDPGHLSEYERAKRMSEFYFDVGAWEKDVEDRKKAEMEEEAMGGRKRKRPTKQDLERFKEQKKQKKIAKTAWLRN